MPETVKIWEVVETQSEGMTRRQNFGQYSTAEDALASSVKLQAKGISCKIETIEVPAANLQYYLGGQLRLYWWLLRSRLLRLRNWWWGLRWT